MHKLEEGESMSSKSAKFLVALVFVGMMVCGGALAQAPRTGGPTPASRGAEVYFIDLKDGATVPSKLKL